MTLTFGLKGKGSDAAAGTLDAPFATVACALKAARHSSIEAGSNATISLRAGVHYLGETIALDVRDAGQ